jgi:hypothetical protein
MMLAAARLHHKRCLLLRNTFPQLERGLIADAKQLYGADGYNETKRRYVFADGCRIEFGYLGAEKDVENYKGPRFDFIGFDELTQFTRSQYLYLFSRLASPDPHQRVRIIATSNPDGPGAPWVMDRWAAWLKRDHPNPALPGEVRYYKRVGDDEIETTADDMMAVSRTFIPATLDDNPIYAAPDSQYRRNILLLDEPFRSALLTGDWYAGLADDANQVIPRAWVRLAFERFKIISELPAFTGLGADIGQTHDPTVIALRHGSVISQLVRMKEPDTMKTAQAIADLAKQHNGWARVDANGIGAGVCDRVRQLHARTVAHKDSERAEDTDSTGLLEFINKRAWAWWSLREKLDPQKGGAVALVPDAQLEEDLCAQRWEKTGAGAIKVLDKEELKKRLGRSPDAGDAVMMAMIDNTPPRPPQKGRPMSVPMG